MLALQKKGSISHLPICDLDRSRQSRSGLHSAMHRIGKYSLLFRVRRLVGLRISQRLVLAFRGLSPRILAFLVCVITVVFLSGCLAIRVNYHPLTKRTALIRRQRKRRNAPARSIEIRELNQLRYQVMTRRGSDRSGRALQTPKPRCTWRP